MELQHVCNKHIHLLYLNILGCNSKHVGAVWVVLATVAVVDCVGDRSVDILGTALCPQWRHHKEPLQQQQQQTYYLYTHQWTTTAAADLLKLYTHQWTTTAAADLLPLHPPVDNNISSRLTTSTPTSGQQQQQQTYYLYTHQWTTTVAAD